MDVEGEPLEDGMFLVVAEGDVVDVDVAADFRQDGAALSVLARGVEDDEDAFSAHKGVRHVVDDVRHPADRPVEHADVPDEGGEFAQGEVGPADDHPAGEEPDEGDGDVHERARLA